MTNKELPTAGYSAVVDPAAPQEEFRPSNFRDYVANSAFVPRSVIALLKGCPDWMPENVQAGFRNIIELRAISIRGLVAGWDHDGNGTPINPSNNIELVAMELYGASISRVIEAALLNPRCVEKHRIGPFKILFIEPDPTFTNAQEAWSVEEAYLTAPYAVRPAERDLTACGGTVEYTLNFGWDAYPLYGDEARAIGKAAMDELNLAGVNLNEPLRDFYVDSKLFGRMDFSFQKGLIGGMAGTATMVSDDKAEHHLEFTVEHWAVLIDALRGNAGHIVDDFLTAAVEASKILGEHVEPGVFCAPTGESLEIGPPGPE